MYLYLLFFPFIGFFVCLFFGRYLTAKGSAFISTVCIFISFVVSIFTFYEVGFCKCFCFIKLSCWIDCELLDASWGFLFDSLSTTMSVLVTFISFLVHLYSTSYMCNDPHQPRFMAYLCFFTFLMLSLLNSDNFLQLFFGWEGVGLCSYLLINFWFTRLQANKSALKAMIVNRIGDLLLTLGILCIFIVFKTLDFALLFILLPYISKINFNFSFLSINFNILTLIGFFLFFGAVGKSAQLGLHTWLPDAMEGPTPVSALIHAATMVTAGVYLIIRCSPIYEHSSNLLFFLLLVGITTSFFAGTTGIFQNDLKKIIAFSTCSQLGYMILACGLSNYLVSIFHVLNHAYFKALLFLSAGSIIHSLSDEQDLRRMGGLQQILPFTYIMIVIGSLTLMGFPFLTGFYSKDAILEITYSKYNFVGFFSFWLGCISASVTAFYSLKLIYMTFLCNPNGYKNSFEFAYEAPFPMAFPLILLSLCSLFLGFFTKDMFVGLGTPFWSNSIFVSFLHFNLVDSEFIPLFIKWTPFLLSLLGSILSIVFYFLLSFFSLYYLKNKYFLYLYIFLNKKWFFDKLQNEIFTSFLLKTGYLYTYKTIDKGFLELFGPLGCSKYILFLGKQVSNLESGKINQYAFLIFIFLIFFISSKVLISFFIVFIDFHLIFIFLYCILFICIH